jgi:hypothetical protein
LARGRVSRPARGVQHEFNASPHHRQDDPHESVWVAMKFRVIPTVLAGTLCLCAATAFARKPPPPPSPPRPASLEQAVKQVQHQTRGHILAADTIQHGQAKVYRVKVLTPQGQVRVMQLRSKPLSQNRPDKRDSDQGGH